MVKYLDNNSGFNQWNAARNAQNSGRRSGFTRFLWYFVLVMAAWWLMADLLSPRQEATQPTESVTSIDVSSVPVSQVASDKVTASVQGLRISNISLSDFVANASDPAGGNVKLLGDTNEFVEIGLVGTNTNAPTASTVWTVSDDGYNWNSPDGVKYSRSITTDGYIITVSDTIVNNARTPVTFTPYARVVRGIGESATSGGVDTGLIAYVNSDTVDESWRALDKKSFAYTTTRGFVGFADQYWETVVSMDSVDQTIRARKIGDRYQADTSAAPVSVAPGARETITTRIFAGPRDQSVLDGVSGLILGIEDTVDYGWFWFLARPMLWVLNTLNSLVMNYGIAIIIMTILLRLAMWPLTKKSYTSMIAMQRMQPEIARVQKLYSNDKARMQIEMMRIYQTHKTSPMSGCLPMLIQIPIFFALYKALLVSVQMRSAHFLWISDLAAMDPYFILPILMGATMWLQQYLQSGAQRQLDTNTAAGQTQRVMKWMPVIFTVMFAWMPAGLVLYWTVSNIFGIGQMYIIKSQHKNK